MTEVGDKRGRYKEIIWNNQKMKRLCGHTVAMKYKAR